MTSGAMAEIEAKHGPAVDVFKSARPFLNPARMDVDQKAVDTNARREFSYE